MLKVFNFNTTEELDLRELRNVLDYLGHFGKGLTSLKCLKVAYHFEAPILLPNNHVLESFCVEKRHRTIKLSDNLLKWNP